MIPTPRDRPILCIDFDGVLHAYTSGWQGLTVIPDGPVPGAVEFLREAVKLFEVYVHSSRSCDVEGRRAMQAELSWWIIDALPLDESSIVNASITYPEHKPPALVTIDDRAITFTGTFPNVKELLAFQPWNKKEAP